VPTPEKLGRPLTLKEKLAAARGAGTAAPAAAAPKPAAAKPAAGAATATAAKAAAGPRTLPPLEKITDPRDLAEALRQAGAKKTKEVAAKTAAAAPAAKAAPGRPAHKEAKPQAVPPKPSKKTALTEAAAQGERRGFMLGSLFVSWVVLGWSSFAAANAAFGLMFTRFMFPNVLAEPPSRTPIGLPTNYEQEEVNERFKAEWGFWVVRSSKYDGTDILYALKSVCTHLGCPPNWLGGEQKFKCPCHGSGFYISGINFEGPAPRPLERFKVSLADDGQVVVDKSQIFQQELGQWSDPDSFVIV
jgi:cytochrome b6-f complex iron-sulfur subunit